MSSLDPKCNQNIELLPEDLDGIDQIAQAAGHGYVEINPELNNGWVDIVIDPNNSRPHYDRRFIKYFNPDRVHAMLFELKQLRERVAELEDNQ